RPMNLIDAHIHVWNDDTGHYPLGDGWKKSDMALARFTPADFFKHAKPHGVSRAVLIQMSYFYPKDLTREIAHKFDNSYMLDMIALDPDTFVGTAVIDPLGTDPAREMTDLARKGVRAFRIHPKLSKQPIEQWLESAGYA